METTTTRQTYQMQRHIMHYYEFTGHWSHTSSSSVGMSIYDKYVDCFKDLFFHCYLLLLLLLLICVCVLFFFFYSSFCPFCFVLFDLVNMKNVHEEELKLIRPITMWLLWPHPNVCFSLCCCYCCCCGFSVFGFWYVYNKSTVQSGCACVCVCEVSCACAHYLCLCAHFYVCVWVLIVLLVAVTSDQPCPITAFIPFWWTLANPFTHTIKHTLTFTRTTKCDQTYVNVWALRERTAVCLEKPIQKSSHQPKSSLHLIILFHLIAFVNWKLPYLDAENMLPISSELFMLFFVDCGRRRCRRRCCYVVVCWTHIHTHHT